MYRRKEARGVTESVTGVTESVTPYRGHPQNGLESITEEIVVAVANKYKVPVNFVNYQLDALKNYCEANGKTYKDYPAALRTFVSHALGRMAENKINQRGGVLDATNL